MSGTDSLSKGVFSFKKASPSSRKSPKKKLKHSPVPVPNSPFLYHDIKSITGNILSRLQKSSFDSVISEVISFLGQPISKNTVISTGVIVTGVNLPDHGDFFSFLHQEIRLKTTNHVAHVKSSSITTLKALVASIVKQLMNQNNSKEENNSEELKRRDLLFPVFQSWYANQYSSDESRPPCVIILEDFESFGESLLQELLYNVREYCEKLPFILLMGVATSVDSVHRALPTNLTSNLSIRKFSSQSSTQTFAEVVDKVIISNEKVPFKLGDKVFKLLFDIFLFHDFSINNFLSGYRFCLLEHLTSNIGKLLMRSVSQLSHNELEVYRRVRSFRKYVEDDISSRAKLLIDDDEFRACLKKCLKQLEVSTNGFNKAVEIMHAIVMNLQRNPIGKYLHTAYLSALSEEFCETSEYKEVFQLLGFLEQTDLQKIINKIVEVAKDDDNLERSLRTHLTSLKNLKNNETPEEIIFKSSSPEKIDKPIEFKTRLSRTQWQENLKENMMKERKKIASVYEGIRSDVLSCLHHYFIENLKPPTTLPFHEVKFFNNSASVKRHLIGDHRLSIQAALSYPGDYLENEDLMKVEKFEIPPILPDISIAFKLYSECGKLINLYDWLQCWLSVIKGENEKDEGNDNVLQARFSQAVAELQFLGFIKSSRRKTDHVSRLTWGAY
ncbi:origin recognition complex subunit 3 [Lepeophtheirus salmonis]|uniref:origin recognition complex subunit 3 n=1 Tax=Lepeophtheirus salmonis TaxID=72036 RepID=UPI001AE2918E|nr:origin recognition complex subunit 3-like [Lepeophtheirus salmonis]